MGTTRMDMAASVARVVAAGVSLVYLIFLLPHLEGFEPAKLSSPWYAGALLAALIWLPLAWLHVRTSGRHLSVAELAASFGPLVFIGSFFGLLIALA